MNQRIRFILMTLIILVSGLQVFADRVEDYKIHQQMHRDSIFKAMEWDEIGPYFMGGRIVDIEGYHADSSRFLLATASGGLWLTDNNGTTWTPIFDEESAITIGDIAISQTDDHLIWVGTGEENSSRSSYAGTGVFKSVDGGKTWRNMGLRDSHHIAEIILHPENPDIVYVAVIGHLYTPNEERGVFRTVDGGETWKRTLYINDHTGVIDLVMHPDNPEVLLAATWERDRKAWNFTESGLGSSIYKTTDGGETWKEKVKGFPQDDKVGRIGLAISDSNPKIVYAFLDNQTVRPGDPEKEKRKDTKKSSITAEKLERMAVEEFLKIDDERLSLFLRENDAPVTFTAATVREYVQKGMITLKQIALMISRREDANSRLLNAKVTGAEVYRSEDGGEQWSRTHSDMLSLNLVSTYGYYFGQIEVSPEEPDIIYILGVPLMRSMDGGKTFTEIPLAKGSYGTGLYDVHPDHHALWIDPHNPEKLLNGNDGGLNISYDRGDTFTKVNNLPLAQCYTVNYDHRDPYYVYTGLQDNGVNMGPSNYRFGVRHPLWRMILGGDGAFVAPEPGNPDIVYAEYQFGSLFRIDMQHPDQIKSIQPQPESSQDPAYRFNWLTPFAISRFNPYILYLGGNRMFRSLDRGNHWQVISPDLTDQKNTDGDVPYATITAIDESPLTAEILYAGTDDGNLWITIDGARSWQRISSGLPDKWITRVVASRFKEERVYVTLTGYREDDFSTYVYKSEDQGKTWESLQSNLPDESLNVIREDPHKENILYLGSDLAPYVSLDRGKSWHSLKCNLPTNAVYDLKVHPREHDLIIGTHGRGVFVLRNLDYIQQLDEKILASPLHIFATRDGRLSEWNPRKAKFTFYSDAIREVEIQISDPDGKRVYKDKMTTLKGFNVTHWDLRDGKKAVSAGDYTLILKTGNTSVKAEFKVK